jgi:integrase/recombinase XerD
MAEFQQFIKERTYLTNVSPRTVQWYGESFKWLGNTNPTEADLKDFVIRMRQAGLKPSSCNNRIRAVNAYLKWAGSSLKVPKLKEAQRVLPTFDVDDIQKIMRYKPKTATRSRLQVLLLTLADTGTRIDEALSLKWPDIDFDNLLLTVTGKGDKQRKIPFSFELRRFLWKYKTRFKFDMVFPTRTGNKLDRRVVLRDTKLLCRSLGIAIPERTLHAFRHTFATNYLRKGGSVFHLQKVLGHSSLDMSRKYAHLSTSDLSAVHQQVSLLGSR